MTGAIKTLREGDRRRVVEFLEQAPYENLFLLSRIDEWGIDRRRLGRLLSFEKGGEIVGLCLDGGTVFVTGNDPDALPFFVLELGRWRRCSSILGPSFPALGVFVGLAERWRQQWGSVSNVRRKQPVMLLDGPPRVEPDPRVKRITRDDFQSYLDASVDMYTEEIGSSPFKYGPGYESFALARVDEGDAYGIVENGEVIFKADLGPRHDGQVQLQGVWLKPDLRGSGQSSAMLSGMLGLVRRRFPQVSLYVNDFNTPAIKSYERLGFRHVGMLSTVHY